MRANIRIISVGLSLLIVAGCSDVSTNPKASATRALSASSPAFDYSGGGAFSFGDSRTQFSVSPDGGSFPIGGLFSINFPKSSICDPDLSSYGPSEWNNSCVPLNRPITITVSTRLSSNGLAMDFQPELRFVPSTTVTISTDLFAPIIRANRDFFSQYPSTLRPLAMYYVPSLGSTRVADYLTDYDLVTRVDLRTGRVWRRVKHFSGYAYGTGEPCDPAAGDPDCIAVIDGGL